VTPLPSVRAASSRHGDAVAGTRADAAAASEAAAVAAALLGDAATVASVLLGAVAAATGVPTSHVDSEGALATLRACSEVLHGFLEAETAAAQSYRGNLDAGTSRVAFQIVPGRTRLEVRAPKGATESTADADVTEAAVSRADEPQFVVRLVNLPLSPPVRAGLAPLPAIGEMDDADLETVEHGRLPAFNAASGHDRRDVPVDRRRHELTFAAVSAEDLSAWTPLLEARLHAPDPALSRPGATYIAGLYRQVRM
jgi:hypothetical protein